MTSALLAEPLPDVVLPACPILKVLKGQKALVTGANSGIGKGIAIALAHAGADVMVNYRNHPEAAEAVAAEGRRCASRVIAHQADVSDEAQVREMFRRAIAELGTIDILINNAGLQQDAPFDRMTLAQWNTVIGVNLTGQFLCAREAVREFRRRGMRPEVSRALGKFICMSSVHEVIPWAGHVNYAASKGGVMLMMKSIAQEVAPLKIRVVSGAGRLGPGECGSVHMKADLPTKLKPGHFYHGVWSLETLNASVRVIVRKSPRPHGAKR